MPERDLTSNVSIILDFLSERRNEEFASHTYRVTSAINLWHVIAFPFVHRRLAADHSTTKGRVVGDWLRVTYGAGNVVEKVHSMSYRIGNTIFMERKVK